MTPTAGNKHRNTAIRWDFMSRGIGRGLLSLAIFGSVYLVLVLLGVNLHEHSEELTFLWPSAGLLLMALLLAPLRLWIWILLVQVTIEIGVGAVHAEHFTLPRYGPFALANSIDAMVGAWVTSRIISADPIPRARNVLLFIAAAAIGAASSAVLGAFAITHAVGGAAYLREWQLWWAGNWLGSICIAPVAMFWAVRWRARKFSVPLGSSAEVLVTGVAMISMTIWVFSTPPGGITTILDMPFILLALVIVAAFRMPPRWSTSITAATAVLVAYFSSRGLGPFAGDPDPVVRVAAAQLYLATLVVVNFLLAVVLFEKRSATQLLRTSDERYRNFIEHSSEAVWRIELAIPMDPGLTVDEQIAWLRAHASVAESNLTYLRLNRQMGVPDTDARLWRADAPWSAIFIQQLGQASQHDYSMDGLQFTIPAAGKLLTFVTGFRGVIERGKLVRIWGVARDVTDLTELNEQLRQKQDRLKLYARELVGAEERARRATAVDLHDGIGQQLVGLAMTLDVAAARAAPEVRLLLGEATSTVREVQSIAQRVIADLSPPGLYELGLEPALKWLSIYMRGKDDLQVQLRVSASDAAIELELRVLVFKVIRELLRNVVKHSRVQFAIVTVTCTPQELRIVVEDQGVGFEWQLSLFEPRGEGFGLWSVADRVREAAGEMSVDTGPGKGCRVTVLFPLGRTALRAPQQGARYGTP
jgi:signal transduction histidine kinase